MRKDIMLCYPYNESRIQKWQRPWLAQPKLDGIRCRVLITERDVTLLSSQGNNLNFAVPHIHKQLHEYPSGEYDGELYAHELSFEEIVGIAKRTTSLHPEYRMIELHLFDMMIDQPQLPRIELLEKIWREAPAYATPDIFVVQTERCVNIDQLTDQLEINMANGYEGMIVRNPRAMYKRARSTDILKIKPGKMDTYIITGMKEEISIHGEGKGRLGAFTCKDDDGRKFSVGTGLNDAQRDEYWWTEEDLIGKRLRIKYQNLTDSGVPRFPVFLEIV